MKRMERMLVGLMLTALCALGLSAAQEAGSDGHLLVADPQAAVLYVYALPELAQVATFENVKLGEHAGFLPLPDGRVLFVDEGAGELVVLALQDEPEIIGRAPVGVPASHIAVDEGLTYAATGSDEAGKTLTLVDLETFESTSVSVDGSDPGLALGGEPLTLYHRHPEGRLEAYAVADLLAGRTEPAATVETDTGGHGEAISHRLNRVYIAADHGVEVLEASAEGLAGRSRLPYAASGREGGRAYFVRVTDSHLYSYLRIVESEDQPWQEWQNDLYVADLETEEVTRVPLAPGLVFRFGLSEPYALFFNVHPEGDFAYLVDVDSASETFHEVVAEIPLAPLTNAPQPDTSPWEAEARRATITPDGRWGFVSHGGDGLVSVIDTEAREVVRTLTVPTPLSGGGYLLAVGPDTPFTDTVGR